MIETICHQCGRRLRVPDEAVGKQCRCPACKTNLTVIAAGDGGSGPGDDEAGIAAEHHDSAVDLPGKRERGRRKKSKKPVGRGGGAAYVLVGAAALVVLACLIGAIWIATRDGGVANAVAGGAPGGGGPGGILPGIGRAPANDGLQAREPEPGPNSWVPPVAPASADPAAWKVVADPPAPRAAELKSLFPIDNDHVLGYALQANCAHAAVIVHARWQNAARDLVSRMEWLRYDLTKPAPIARVLLADDKDAKDVIETTSGGAHVQSALSRSGTRLAVQDGRSRFIEVRAADGKKVGRIPLVPAANHSLRWLAFGGEDRVWTAVGPRLVQWDAQTGKQTAEVAGDVWCHPTLSPGGKFLAAIAGEKLLVLAAADGAQAGAIDLPQKLGVGQDHGWSLGHVAFDPSGKHLAASLADSKFNIIVAVWELATGKRTDAVQIVWHNDRLNGGVQWAGERRLLIHASVGGGAELLDLDLHAPISDYYDAAGLPLWRGMTTPDPRLWQLRGFHDHEVKKLEDKLPKVGDKTATLALTASSLPKELTRAAEEAKAGVLWHPGVPCRLKITGAPGDMNDRIQGSTAQRLAKMGYHIDPAAPLTLELHLEPLAGFACCSRVLKGGQLAFASDHHQLEEGLLALPRTGLAPHLPPLILRDADMRPLAFPTSFTPGVDGLLDGQAEMPKLGAEKGRRRG